jgi:uncharacterized protein YjaG (DUF416 family)
MMAEAFDPGFLRQRIEQLPALGRLAFLLSIAERLLPNYAAFSRRHAWGEPDALRRALDLGWRALERKEITPAEIEARLAECEAVTPDTEDFDSELVSPALDAAASCALVLELLKKDDPEKVVDGASLAHDTVDMYVQELERLEATDPLLERKIARHQLMRRELERQKTDLDLLAQTDWNRHDTVSELARQWRAPHSSNIRLA